MDEYLKRFCESMETLARAVDRIATAQETWVAARLQAPVTAPDPGTGEDPAPAPEALQMPSVPPAGAEERLALIARAGELGLEVPPRTRVNTIKAMIAEAEAKAKQDAMRLVDQTETTVEVPAPVAPPPVVEPSPAEVTDEDLRKALVEVSRAKGVDKAISILTSVGKVKAVSQIAADLRQQFIAACKAAVGE